MKKSKKSKKRPIRRGESGIPLPSNMLLMTLRITMICFLPLALCFSYHPVISFGSSGTMNFEFSIAEIYLVIFALISIFDFENLRMLCFYYGKRLFLFALLPLYAALSAIWSPDHLRAIFTAGLLAILIFDALQANLIIHNTPFLEVSFKRHLLKSAIFISIICWLQCFLDVLGVSRNFTGLCEGCTYQAFGFPHPSGFAIEPQFMGNLLIVPALLAIFNLVYDPKNPLFLRKSTQIIVAVFLTSTLFLTLSRGAIYAFLIGLAIIFLMGFPSIKYKIKKSKLNITGFGINWATFAVIPIVLGSFLLSLAAEGVFAQISPTNDTFWTGVTKSVHQLSLGKIDLRPEELKNQSEEKPEETKPDAQSSTFTGYVEQSTSFRTRLANDALDVWNDSPTNLIFGTGVGSAGTKMLEKDPELGIEKEIVQNQYAEVLLELGLVGVVLIVLMFVKTLYLGRAVDPISGPMDFIMNPLLLASVVAFLVSIIFFSGLPNALHIYLLPLLLTHPSV